MGSICEMKVWFKIAQQTITVHLQTNSMRFGICVHDNSSISNCVANYNGESAKRVMGMGTGEKRHYFQLHYKL